MLKLLVPVDGSAASERLAQYLARLQQAGPVAEFHLLNVQIPAVSGHGRTFVSQEDLDGYYRDEGNRALAPARQILAAAGITHKDHLAVGHPATTITDFAAQHGFDGIVMGTHGRSGFGGVLMGSVAAEVVRNAHVPVTLVK
jgi:nucleotide-binding universal stress UspA family protein